MFPQGLYRMVWCDFTLKDGVEWKWNIFRVSGVCVLAKDVPSAGDYTLNVRVVLSVCVRE